MEDKAWHGLKRSETAAAKAAEKDSNDLDAVAGNAEDDIGDLIASIREKELLYGDTSLLAVYGPMVASICASPKNYKVSCDCFFTRIFSVFRLTDLTVTCPPSGRMSRSDQAHVCQCAVLRDALGSAVQHAREEQRSGDEE